jgi:hypothetical protein
MARQSHYQSGYGFAALSGRYSNLELLDKLVDWVAELGV